MADEVKQIQIEIDGKLLNATPDQTVMQVADAAGIYIPRFCYHKLLSIAANCRMCLVEVEKAPKTLPACATPVMPGMKVFTKSAKTIESQRIVMEFLLINHPLDCPICDQGGECELQDLSMGYGSSHTDYNECKRSVADDDIGPLIETEMTRCIYCTRCVRFGTEVAGLRELGLIGRGEDTEVSTFVKHTVHSEVSGNIIDLCPVGALTSKPFRFRARAWELDQFPSISPHDCLGTSINVHSRYGEVMRVVSRENAEINQTWIADRDRFSYTSLNHIDRLAAPMIRKNGELQPVEWEEAFEFVVTELTKALSSPDQLGILANPSTTLEEYYLLTKIGLALGTSNIDYRLREKENHPDYFPLCQSSLPELETCDGILLIGSNIQKEQPIAATRLRKAALKGTEIFAINLMDYRFNFTLTEKKIVAPQHLARALAALINQFQKQFDDVQEEALASFALKLKEKKKLCIMLGSQALNHAEAASIFYLAKRLSEITGAKLNLMTEGANATGANLVHKVLAKNAGLSAYEMIAKPRSAYFLFNAEPEFDFANAALTQTALKQAKFVLSFSSFLSPALQKHATVILPVGPFTETSGTFINAFGDWQSFNGAAKAFGASRPGWKVLRVLANFLQLDNFGYESSEDIRHEVKALSNKVVSPEATAVKPANFSLTAKKQLRRIGEIPLYNVDCFTRRAKPLQDVQVVMEGDVNEMRVHPDTAKEYGLPDSENRRVRQNGCEKELRVKLDPRIAKEAVWIAGATEVATELGDLFGEIEVT